MSAGLRVGIISHGHPQFSTGGVAQASYALFRYLKARSDIEPVYIARASPKNLGHSGPFASFRGRSDELLWAPPGVDSFRLVSLQPVTLRDQAVDLFSRAKLDVVHIHHFSGFGVDIVQILQEELGLPVVVTLHEYLLICHSHGQMVKTNGRLCYESSYAECNACFPKYSSGKFFVRRGLILDKLSHASLFISPSQFLARRFVAWGVAPEQLRIIENPLMIDRPDDLASGDKGVEREAIVLGYFGQFTRFKGIDVLLDALLLLPEDVRRRLRVELFGPEVADGGGWWGKEIEPRLAVLRDCVASHGRYENEDVLRLMQTVDWVVVPSIWWENSPVVIQEARAAGIPVLCADIGGMREKVRQGIDGAHFLARSPSDLAAKIQAIVEGRLSVQRMPWVDDRSNVDEIVEGYRAVVHGRLTEARVHAGLG